jgi:hypothetical protein
MTVATPLKPSTTYNELVEDTPLAITTTSATTPVRLIGEGYPFKWVRAYRIRVRDMGTCTYIGFGTEQAQEIQLIADDQRLEYQCGRYEVIDLNKIWVVADQADGVVEVSAKFLPQRMYGNVLIADRM